jgi:hypothetical protein
MTEKQQQWGYDDEGNAQIFYGDLPKGWHDAPVKPEHHPNHPNYGKASGETPKEPEHEPKRRGRPPKEVKHGDDA